LISKS